MASKKLFTILWSSAFACALLFGGWGFFHLRSFFDQPARTAFLFLLLARNAGETLTLQTNPFSTRIQLRGLQCWIPLLTRLAMAFLCFFLPFADRRSLFSIGGSESLRYAGVLLFLAGAAVQLSALRALGSQYSVHVTLQDSHRLVQDGPYNIIRHPMYLGLSLSIPGVLLVFRSWLILPLSALLILFLISRIRQEEKLLRLEFGPEFESYRKRTKFVVPYLC